MFHRLDIDYNGCRSGPGKIVWYTVSMGQRQDRGVTDGNLRSEDRRDRADKVERVDYAYWACLLGIEVLDR